MKALSKKNRRFLSAAILVGTLAATVALSACPEFIFLLISLGVPPEVFGILGIRTSPDARPVFLERAHLSVRHPEGTSNNTPLPALAPFFGNLSALTISATGPAGQFFGLQRQSDCSLTRFDNTALPNNSNSGVVVTQISQTPHYENTIHANAFSTTTPGVWPHGCVDSILGTSSRPVLLLGFAPNGTLRVAGLSANGVLTSSVKADGTFTGPTPLATDVPPLTMLAGDLNKDGNPDIVTINTDGLTYSVTVFLGKSDGTYQPGVNTPIPGTLAQFGVLDDLDGDGNLDLVVSSSVGSSNPALTFSTYLGKGDGTFKPVQSFTSAGMAFDASAAFITADVNGDHKKDIVTAQGVVLLGTGDGVTYTVKSQSAFPRSVNSLTNYGTSIVAADFDNDGKLDIATDDSATIRIFHGNGDGTFTKGNSYSAMGDLGFLVATDLDGDGNVDLWCGYSGAGIFGGDTINVAYALLGNGNGTFQGAQSLPTSFISGNLLDVNKDGIPDLVGPTSFSAPNTTVTTFLGQANGTFKTGPQVTFSDFSSTSFVLGDFDGDGNPDLITLSSKNPAAGYYIARGDGTGGFGTPTLIPAPVFLPPPDIDLNLLFSGLIAADFNHDGKLDIIYCFTNTSFATNVITEGFVVQLGNGNGTFKPPVITTTYSSMTPPLAFFGNMLGTVADVNGDNFPDVFLVVPTVITNGTLQHQVELFIANGDGSFKAPTNITLTGNMVVPTGVPSTGNPIAVADVNGDGKMDLVAGGASADGTVSQLAVALGNGNGTFQPPAIMTLQGFGYVNGPVLADFDGDGKLDVFIGGEGIFPGVGNGTFESFSNGDGTVASIGAVVLNTFGAAASGDFTGSGRQDLIVSGVVLLNKSGVVPPPVPAATTTAVTAAPNPAAVGATVTLTATVSSTTAGTITGTVTFFDGANSIGTGSVGAGGVAMLALTTLSAGSHSITAMYGGDANFAASTSAPFTTSIAGAMTLTILNAAPLTGDYGVTEFAFDINVGQAGPPSGTPTGTVSLFDGTQLLQTEPLQNGSAATIFQFPFEVQGGTHSYTAKYSGDAQFAASTSTPVIVTVNPAPATMSLTASTLSASFGTAVTFTATVTSTVLAPLSGAVDFFDGTSFIGEGVHAGPGIYTLATSSLTTGSHSITAHYVRDPNFAAPTSNAVTVAITKATTSSTVSASPNPADSGANVTITANVTATGTGTITGTVTFSDGVTSIGMGTIGANGIARLQTTALSVGTHSITAAYSGDANFVASTSPAATVTINPVAPVIAPTSTALGASPNPAGLGVNVTLTATVTSATAGAITGTVTFLDGGNSIGTGGVGAGGVATFQTTSLSMATHSITAMYGGDANYATSTSQAVSLVITVAPAFSLSVAPQSVSVRRNEPGTAVVTVTPMNGFNQQVQLSCSAAEGIECEFQPGSVTPDGAPVTSNLTVSFEDEGDARPAKSAGIGSGPGGGDGGSGGGAGRFAQASKTIFVPLFACELLLLAGMWRRRKLANGGRGADIGAGVGARFGSRLQTAYAIALLLTVATFVAGCAGTPRHHGSGTINITGTAANNQTATVPLTVTVE